MTEYSAEEVRAMASDLRGAPGTSRIGTHISLPTAMAVAIYEALCAYAERIKADEGAVEVRLWDTQWMNIVNHDNCYRDWDKEDAINHAVRMTEQAIARNVADGKLPPARIAAQQADR